VGIAATEADSFVLLKACQSVTPVANSYIEHVWSSALSLSGPEAGV
jgi:hypothetical protein